MNAAIAWILTLATLGVLFIILTYLERRNAKDDDTRSIAGYKLAAITVFTLGIIVHTMGDVLNTGNAETIEMRFETAGHIIIMIGSVLIIVMARRLGRRTDA